MPELPKPLQGLRDGEILVGAAILLTEHAPEGSFEMLAKAMIMVVDYSPSGDFLPLRALGETILNIYCRAQATHAQPRKSHLSVVPKEL